ncbi:MAG TPA: toll/interleukin-1 receptor domain-containing protein [Bryobacteraceae bacterium]|nr:toll/interleukin-1 receptor domain-containing protein [Bryobacteraceae bacterium]
MAFSKHLFISYAHLDNEPLSDQQQGWITRFHASLSTLLSMRMGRRAEIWRDSKLRGNDVFADEIVQQFPNTALLVSVLTPRYVESEWCTREVREFLKSAEASGGIVVDNKARIFKVIKAPVDTEEPLPQVMKDALGYPFYVFDDEETPIELDPAYGGDLAQKYNLKLAKLAWDVAQLIKKIEAATPAPSPGAPPAAPAATADPPKPVVYLAETSYDRREARDSLESDLRMHGYTVLPDRPLSDIESEYVQAVGEMIGRSKLSVHLVGSRYGAVPDGPSEKSVVMLQNELAIQQARKNGLQRIIWMTEGNKSESERQQKFLDALVRDAELQYGADLVTGDLEKLRGVVHASLQKIEKPPAAEPGPGPQSARLVYLICDERDRKATIPVRKYLKAQGIEVKIPLFEGDANAVRQSNQELLTEANAVLLFYGAGDEAWKRMVESDLRKSPAWRGDRPALLRYTYLAEPSTDDKTELIELEEPNLISALSGFLETAMEPFTKELQKL